MLDLYKNYSWRDKAKALARLVFILLGIMILQVVALIWYAIYQFLQF